MGIATRYRAVEAAVERCCLSCGRDPREVRLVGVSKTVGVSGAEEAFVAGCRDFGENRPDQIVAKSAAMPDARWHFIGNIQSRRIPDIVASSMLIHSVFELRHARKIDLCARALGKVQDILVEVNVSGEKSKSGLAPEDARAFVEECAALGNVCVRGLMTMAPQGSSSVARECFEGLARLRAEIKPFLGAHDAELFDELSMGMSEDWEEGIRAGATIVRVGRAIFSDSFE